MEDEIFYAILHLQQFIPLFLLATNGTNMKNPLIWIQIIQYLLINLTSKFVCLRIKFSL